MTGFSDLQLHPANFSRRSRARRVLPDRYYGALSENNTSATHLKRLPEGCVVFEGPERTHLIPRTFNQEEGVTLLLNHMLELVENYVRHYLSPPM